MIKIYGYNKCDTCRKAIQFLEKQNIPFENKPIVEQPPTITELKKMLGFIEKNGGTFKNLFNTSGVQYRELGISEKLKSGWTEKAALQLLSENGKLIKRPFLLSDDFGFVGFKIDEWKKIFK